jgi:hypothetical protein
VIASDGRTLEVHPAMQIVEPMLACVTAGFSAPGVQCGSGRRYRPAPVARHMPGEGWRWTTRALSLE